jgi:2-keto-3-deoxy-L-rhamnonate aldolase RhmA
MRPNKLRQLLDSDKPSISTHIHSTWPSVIEAVGHTGLYDYVEFVGEYGPYDLHDLDNMCRAAELYDLGMMLKVDQEPRGFLAQRAVGSGFQSLLFADPRSAADVQECVDIARPETPEDGGNFGVAMRRFAYMEYGGGLEYVEALRQTVVMAMIEKAAAVEDLDAILQVKGLDMVQWGPADYCVSIGKAGQYNDEQVKQTERRVIDAALKAGVQPRAEIRTADDAKYYQDMGVKHFCVGTDISILHNWWKKEGEALRKVVE